MSRLLTLGSIVLSFLVAGPAAAQNPVATGGVVSGIVRTGERAPVPGAMIALRRPTDTLVVAGSTTDSTGAFRLQGVAPGSYRVEIRRLGFRMVTRSGVTITPSADHVDLGVIRLEPSAVALEGVAITAARPAVGVLPDRNVYSTRDVPVAAGGTAADVLRSVPELEVSVEGRVTTGGAKPEIYINGRPAPMQGEALDRYLQQLPAEQIDRVEVIANPSARYAAEGQGGIVNIVMKRGTGLGVSGSVALNAGTRNQQGGSGNINFEKGRLSLFGSASANFFGNRSRNSDLRQNLNAQPTTYIQQDARNRNSGGSGNLSLAAEVKMGPRGTFWADAGAGRNALGTEALTAYTHLDDLKHPTQRYDRVNETDIQGSFGSAAMGYRNVAEAGEDEWSVELRRNVNDDDYTSESARRSPDPDGVALDLTPELTFAGEGQGQSDFSLEANLVRGWGESGRLEAGYRGSLHNSGDDSRMWADSAGDPGIEDEALGDFRQRERIHAGFVTLDQQAGRFRVQLGVRGEQAEMRRALPLLGESFTSSYRDLFPTANISTKLGAAGQLRLSYSKRVDRPEGEILDPVTPTLDPLNRLLGNPYLMPRYTHSLSLTASRVGRMGSLQLSPFYRRTVDSWDQVRTVDEAGVSTVTWENLATVTSYGGSINASVTQLGAVGGFVSVRAYREVRDASNLRTDFSGSSTRFSVIGNFNVRASSALSLQGALTYLPARDLPQGRISSMVFSTLGARQQLWGRRGAITLSVVDPFELQHFTFTTRDGTHVQVGSSTLSARRASLGLSYSFGRPPQGDRRRRAPEEREQETQVLPIR
jgi:hypothetical protein